jgi:hypothetical protein
MLIGMVLLAVSRSFDGLGVITGFMAIWLGATAGSLRRWQEEPGLWMLSALILAMCCTFWALTTWGRIRDVIRQVQAPFSWSLEVDVALATLLLAVLVRFSATVACTNWKLTQSGRHT